jgi:hypothetical protein
MHWRVHRALRPCSNGFVCSPLIREELLQKAEVVGQVPLLMGEPGMRKPDVQLPRNVQCAYWCCKRANIDCAGILLGLC